ncbi:MAG: peptidoglycan DD-metalloendopeptidase family protein, partial [Candidatus Terrybacteria bacterium]|nr:peptidoglycan DD-metalloendopeptidase family protein [Candidatus Terrybacteria bacterium]
VIGGIVAGVLLASGASVNADLIDDLRAQIAAKDAAVKELAQQATQAKSELTGLQGRERTLANEIARLDRQIASFELEIRLTESRIENADLRIQQLLLEISQHEEEIAEGENRIGELLRTMQLSEDQTGAVALVFAGRPFSEVFDSLRSAELLDEALAANIRNLKDAKAALEESKQQSEEERTQAAKLRDELLVQRALVTSEQDERDDLLITTRREEGNYQRLLGNILAQQQAVQREILDLEAQLRRAINPSTLPGKGILGWPVASVRITQGYGSTSSTGFINDQYEFHNGLDIGASTPGVIGDPVYAAASGTVVGVGNDGRYAYGRWVAIDHKNGLVTLYAHLSLQEVATGQKVAAGQVIGRMGSTGFSTGPHLHFTVYAADTFTIESRWYGPLPIGGSLNPLDFLGG